jgi:hypothetical protein
MENKTGKVTSASFKKEWTGKFGTMYDHNIEFANGDNGVYTSKKKEQDSFKVGEEVPYTIEKTVRNGFTNYKIAPVSEKGNGFGGGARSFAPKNYKADFISFAASYTKDLIVGGKAELKDFGKTFDAMYKKMADKLDEVNGASASNTPETK